MTIETITAVEYARLRAIVDTADAYWQAHATFARGGWSSMGPELSKHPDYAACTNEMRGLVEQYELLRDTPAKFVCYVGSDNATATVWTGQAIGKLRETSRWRIRSHWSTHMHSYEATIAGKRYIGRGCGQGMSLVLRRA